MKKKEFLEKSRNIHGYKYDYLDLKDNFSVKDKIIISFEGENYLQTVEKHLMGRCPEKNFDKLTTKDFIERSKKIFGDKYDYSETEYKGSLNEVKIILDGFVYYQRAQSHLEGISPEYNKNDLRSKVKKVEFNPKKEIEEFLDEYEFLYEKNQRISGFNFSFYLLDFRLVIEYYSEPYFNDSYLIKERINKRDYCEDDFIDYIEFTYKDKNILWELLFQNLIHLSDNKR